MSGIVRITIVNRQPFTVKLVDLKEQAMQTVYSHNTFSLSTTHAELTFQTQECVS